MNVASSQNLLRLKETEEKEQCQWCWLVGWSEAYDCGSVERMFVVCWCYIINDACFVWLSYMACLSHIIMLSGMVGHYCQ